MPEPMWSGKQSRKIVERIVIEGTLVLETPAHFGGGENDGTVMSLLVDALDGESPLLTGASIGGALRSYLWSIERGYGKKQKGGQESAASLLFGTARDDDPDGTGDQSRLIIDDAHSHTANVVYRDGVRLDEQSRTAAEDALYAIQLWDAGTSFPLRFELLISEGDPRERLVSGLVTALDGLATGEITLGARKQRGYGRVRVDNWRVRSYAVGELSGLMAWLREGGQPLADTDGVEYIYHAFGNVRKIKDQRELVTLDAWFTLDGSLLIRSTDDVADMKHLTNSNGKAVLSGTSVTGALRARAAKIINTLTQDPARSAKMVNDLFGSPHNQHENRTASRLIVEERMVDGGVFGFVQSRVSIDRFTGGALDTALFNQQPLFGSAERGVHLRIQLRKHPEKAIEPEVGLLLLLLKDLWTGDLTLGGERSVGRGRLRGECAQLTYQGHTWAFNVNGAELTIEPEAESLNTYLQSFLQELGVHHEA
jgi:CRISPR/Cas system CSM-associated protein Csm3 (group 7 of RAMP superfamily)